MRPELNCCRKSPRLLTALKEKALSQWISFVCRGFFVKCPLVLLCVRLWLLFCKQMFTVCAFVDRLHMCVCTVS